MSSTAIMDAILSKIKTVLSQKEEVLASDVSPEQAEEVNRVLGEAMSAGWTEGLRKWLGTAETDAETIQVNGVMYRYKLDSEKEFLTPGGLLKLTRRVYQPDAGGKCHIPLDAAWGMEGQFATVAVRDAALYAVALGTPQEAETLLGKCSLFQPSATAIKRMAQQMGQWLEEHEDQVLTEIRAEEAVSEETRVLCASLDGVNVLLSEPGKKKGRPNERPHEGASRESQTPTCYKNAMVGSVSFYGDVPEGKTSPMRLMSRYAARMPEARAPTLKAKFEQELRETESRLSDHVTEHLSKAAEAIFGKGSRKAQAWYDRYCSKLKDEDGGAERVLRSLDYYERTVKLSKSRREALGTERTFFTRNGHRMDYARFRRNGWPIGSGPVEAACKSVVKTRLCRSGMRWSRCGGQHILSLRTYVKSGRWTGMWKQYKRIERARSPCNTT